MADRCLYFGCWNRPGHYLHLPGGKWNHQLEYYSNGTDRVHLDGTLAPRRHKLTGALCWAGQGAVAGARNRITWDSEECPQGQFLLHQLTTGYAAIQWWDRNQGDERGACNSTILLEGTHSSEGVLAAGRAHFPHAFERLAAAGVALLEVHCG